MSLPEPLAAEEGNASVFGAQRASPNPHNLSARAQLVELTRLIAAHAGGKHVAFASDRNGSTLRILDQVPRDRTWSAREVTVGHEGARDG